MDGSDSEVLERVATLFRERPGAAVILFSVLIVAWVGLDVGAYFEGASPSLTMLTVFLGP